MERDDERLRLEAVKTLGKIGDPRAIPALIRALQDSDGRIRRWAAKSLTRTGEPAVEPLIQVLDTENRYAAIEILGDIGDERAVGPLEALLADDDPETRKLAARSLALNATSDTLEPLTDAIKDPHWPVRVWTVYGLGLTGRKRGTTQPLLDALKDESSHVRSAAATALGDTQSLSAVDPLTRMLDDEDELLRLDAVCALGEIAVPEAVKPLVKRLSDPDPYVRIFAARAISKIGTSQALTALRECRETTNYPDLREELADILTP